MTPESINDAPEYDLWRGIPIIAVEKDITVRESHRVERMSDHIIEETNSMTQCLDVSWVWHYSKSGLDRIKVQHSYLSGNGGDFYFITRGKRVAFELLKDLGVLEEATIVEPKTDSLRTMRTNFILQKRIRGGWGDWFTDIEPKKGRRINLLGDSHDTFPLAETFRIGLEGADGSAKTISFKDDGTVRLCDPSLFEQDGLFGITSEECRKSGGIFIIHKPGEAITRALRDMNIPLGFYNISESKEENLRMMRDNYYETVNKRKELGLAPNTSE